VKRRVFTTSRVVWLKPFKSCIEYWRQAPIVYYICCLLVRAHFITDIHCITSPPLISVLCHWSNCSTVIDQVGTAHVNVPFDPTLGKAEAFVPRACGTTAVWLLIQLNALGSSLRRIVPLTLV
jgi:hypothetical protein